MKSIYATIDNIPSKVSELENDAGYLTEHQDLSNYYTKAETDAQIAAHVPEIDLSEYYTSEQVDQIVTDAIAELLEIPDGYTRLDYIRSNGTQYIDTGVTPNQDYGMVIDLKLNSVSSSNNFLAGSRTSASSRNFSFVVNSSGKWRYGYNDEADGEVDADTSRHVLEADKNILYIDGSVAMEHPYAAFEGYGSIYLFSVNNDGDAKGGKLSIYSAKIYNGSGELVRDFVPVRNDSTYEIGLYDKVNGLFYGNAGTGIFTAG